jgi:murein DD-endopeptidase MepM/ murein hydrolase activator NlpD
MIRLPNFPYVRRTLLIVIVLCVGTLLWWGSYAANADSTEVDKLKQEINERSQRLLDIEKEIAQFEQDLKKVGAEKNTLQKAINQLELERKKLQAEVRYTEQKINATDLELSQLILEIEATESDIDKQKAAIAEIIRRSYKKSEESIIEIMLRHEHLSDFWSSLDTLLQVQRSMADKVADLDSLKLVLDEKREATEDRRGSLVSLKNQYDDQSTVLANNKAERSQLLAATRNQEVEYQKILKAKQEAREAIMKEMRDYEAKLQFILDPTTIPTAGTAVFAWPLKNVIITQYFGGTEFAKRNASVYGGRAYHPGVDMGAPRGTPIYAPLAGTVRATGNTDAVPGCYSWGKWTLIDHANGLSTLYAHQDVISVTPGQRVATGEIIGYVGNTGFSTGPHLHFTVYAKDGVSVRAFNEIKTTTSCGAATTPVAATEAYLDPMLYLPPY